MNEPRLEYKPLKIRQLVQDYRSGHIVIPEFQREYVWKPRQAPKLIDSLYRGYPISSLLVWQTSDEITSRRSLPRPTRSGPIGWLIDGQQRLITLSRSMYGDEGIDIVFNASGDSFQLSSSATKRDPAFVRLVDLWDDELYRGLRRSLDGSRSADQIEAKYEKVRRILDYEVPVVSMVDHSFDDAVDAFTRINTLGVKLRGVDIQSARVAAKHTGFIRDEVIPFLQDLNHKGFSRISIMHLFRACAFIATPDGRVRTPLHELASKDVQVAWEKTKRATIEAINLIKGELGLANMDLLWSGALLVPLIVLNEKAKPRERSTREMIGWLGLAALLHRYSASADSQLDQDLKACRTPDPIGSLLTNLRQIRPRLSAVKNDFAGTINDRSGLLASYIACKHRGLLDFFTAASMAAQETLDKHHILPRGQFAIADRASRADTIANIAFISSSVNRSIGQSGPEVYLKKVAPKILASQCVPLDPGLWLIQRSDDFLTERQRLLAESFNDFLTTSLPNRVIG